MTRFIQYGVEWGHSMHIADNFVYIVVKSLAGISSFDTDVHRDILVQHKKYDCLTSYINTWKPKKCTPSFFFVFG